MDALNWIYQNYPNANYEFAGTIYAEIDGNYYATTPVPGSERGSKPNYGRGGYSQLNAYYHTHGQCTKGMNGGNDVFSPDDMDKADLHTPFFVPSFLETPGHKILRCDPDPQDPHHKRGNATQFSRDAIVRITNEALACAALGFTHRSISERR
jgi:hypothetical protein